MDSSPTGSGELYRVVCVTETADGPRAQPISIWFHSWKRAEQEMHALQRQPEYANARLTISGLSALRRARERKLPADR